MELNNVIVYVDDQDHCLELFYSNEDQKYNRGIFIFNTVGDLQRCTVCEGNEEDPSIEENEVILDNYNSEEVVVNGHIFRVLSQVVSYLDNFGGVIQTL